MSEPKSLVAAVPQPLTARRVVGKVPGTHTAVAIYYLLRDRAVPLHVKLTVAGCLAYIAFPADLIPDMIPVAGLIDDGASLLAALTVAENHISDEHRAKAEALFGG